MSVQAHPYAVDDGIDYSGDQYGGGGRRRDASGSSVLDAILGPYRELAPSPTTLAMVGVGLLGAGLGAAAGSWLGTRRDKTVARPAKVARSVKKVEAKTAAAAALAPLAIRLLGNPVVRQFVIRMAMRQLRRKLPL